MASGLIVTGGVAPSIAVIFGLAPGVRLVTVILSSLFWLGSASALHWYARFLLGRLRT